MTNQCTDCGAELLEGSKFCTACGKNVEEQPEVPQQPESPSEPEPELEQPVEQKQPPAPKKVKKKSRKKLLLGVLVIVVIVVIGVILAVYLQGGGGETPPVVDDRFVGDWQQNISNPSVWSFNDDGTFGVTPPLGILTNGTWAVSGNLLCFNDNVVCYSFVFSDNDKSVILNKTGLSTNYPASITLSKTGLQGTTQTPDIQCSSDAASNRIIIESIGPNVRWSDIEISTNNVNATWQVQDTNQKGLARIGFTSTITVYMSDGDSILVMTATGDVMVTLTFKPTNAVLGHWTVNV
jgi:zinc-ribbon domain